MPKSPIIKEVQELLVGVGEEIAVDGFDGPATQAIVARHGGVRNLVLKDRPVGVPTTQGESPRKMRIYFYSAMVSLFMWLLIISAFLMFFGCSVDTVQNPVEAKPVTANSREGDGDVRDLDPVSENFVWHLEEVNWLSPQVQLDEATRMLRYIDEQLFALDKGVDREDRARGQYLEVRVQLLYHIHNVSQYVRVEE